MVRGLKRYYKGRIVEENYTKLGQQDYQAEITQLRSKNPKAVFAFLPGGMGIQFLKQYDQAGLRSQLPLYTVYTVDEFPIPAVKDAAVGIYETRYWSPDLKNPANQKFVSDYKKKYGKLPVFYGAQSYDSTLQLGVMLFLMAAGLTLVLGIMNVVNLAHGSLYMVGAYLTVAAFRWTGSYLLGVALGLAGTLVVGMIVEVLVLRALYQRDHLDQVLATFGLILFFNELVAIIWG